MKSPTAAATKNARRFHRVLRRVAVSAFVAASTSWAAAPPAMTKLADASRLFQTEPSVTVYAEVAEVLSMPYSERASTASQAMVLKLRNGENELLAYLGPKHFLEDQGYTFQPGDHLTLQGVFATVNGAGMLFTRAFAEEGSVVALRASDGDLEPVAVTGDWQCPDGAVCQR